MLRSSNFAEATILLLLLRTLTQDEVVCLAAEVLTGEQERQVGDIVIPEPEAHESGRPDDWKNQYGKTCHVVKCQWTGREGANAVCPGFDRA